MLGWLQFNHSSPSKAPITPVQYTSPDKPPPWSRIPIHSFIPSALAILFYCPSQQSITLLTIVASDPSLFDTTKKIHLSATPYCTSRFLSLFSTRVLGPHRARSILSTQPPLSLCFLSVRSQPRAPRLVIVPLRRSTHPQFLVSSSVPITKENRSTGFSYQQ